MTTIEPAIEDGSQTISSAAQAIISLSRGEWPAEKVVNPEVKAKFRW